MARTARENKRAIVKYVARSDTGRFVGAKSGEPSKENPVHFYTRVTKRKDVREILAKLAKS
jgi:hypothetical protein